MAQKFLWDKSYELGVFEIDLQHKKLIDISNTLYDLANNPKEDYKIAMEKILKQLIDYTDYHFKSEEDFMKSKGYIGVDAHKVAHDNFIMQVTAQTKKLDKGNPQDALRFYDYIANWILTHIAKADKIWANFILNK